MAVFRGIGPLRRRCECNLDLSTVAFPMAANSIQSLSHCGYEWGLTRLTRHADIGGSYAKTEAERCTTAN